MAVWNGTVWIFLVYDFPKSIKSMWDMSYKIIGARQNQTVVWELALFDYLPLFYWKSMAVLNGTIWVFLVFSFPKVNEVNVKYAI